MTHARWIMAVSLLTLTAATLGARHQPRGGVAGHELVAIGGMHSARAAHQATLLPDGAVLITGGCVDEGCSRITNSAELYDPGSRSFHAIAPLALPRAGHRSVRLHDGRVLVVGGWTGTAATATAEIYDPATGQWTGAGRLEQPRQSPIAELLPDGRVLLAGGTDAGMTPLASAEIFDPRSNGFVRAGSMLTPRASHAAAALSDGRILISGGNARRRGTALASTEIYDPTTDRFHPAGDMIDSRHKHGSVRLPDGRVLIIAGSDERDRTGLHRRSEIFDPATRRFSAGPELNAARYKIVDAVVVLPSGAVLVAGGGAHAELWQPEVAGGFRALSGAMDAGRSFATATALEDGSVLVLGGYDHRIRPTAAAWLLVPSPAT
jgi:hypothetical protein